MNSPACQKEVYTSLLQDSDATEPAIENETLNSGRSLNYWAPQEGPGLTPWYNPEEEMQGGDEPGEDDILPFKRVAQETIYLGGREEEQNNLMSMYYIKSEKHRTPAEILDSSQYLLQRQSMREHGTD